MRLKNKNNERQRTIAKVNMMKIYVFFISKQTNREIFLIKKINLEIDNDIFRFKKQIKKRSLLVYSIYLFNLIFPN